MDREKVVAHARDMAAKSHDLSLASFDEGFDRECLKLLRATYIEFSAALSEMNYVGEPKDRTMDAVLMNIASFFGGLCACVVLQSVHHSQPLVVSSFLVRMLEYLNESAVEHLKINFEKREQLRKKQTAN